MAFTHLHSHSHYSLLDGLPKIPEFVARAKELGMDSIALTDHGALYGAVEFYKAAKAAGIKPIIGVETYVAFERMEDKRPNIDDKRYHLILLAKNNQGYKNLIKLITLSHLKGFYYKPRIDKYVLRQYSEGLIGLSACIEGEVAGAILANNMEKAERLALEYQDIFGDGNFFLELQYHANISKQKKINDGLMTIAHKTGIPLVATQDFHYLRPEDAKAQDILMLINTGADPNDPERLSLIDDDFSMRSSEEMSEYFKDIPEAIENTQKIAEMCNVELQLGKYQLPYFEVPDGYDANTYLAKLCADGLARRYALDISSISNFQSPISKQIQNQSTQKDLSARPSSQQMESSGPNDQILKITDRVDYELEVIKKTGFAPYFLIVQDFVNWAKNQGIVVGPGRGSAAGSLVSYLLNITNIDPLKYNLLFERFLNPERISMPDIDLDFTDLRRNEVIKYVAEKYGQDNVAQIITFGTMAARAVIRDVTRALGQPYALGDRLAKMIPFNFTLDQALQNIIEFKQAYDTEPEVKEIVNHAKKLEGVARHASTHACGVVITKEPMDTIVPRQHASQDDQTIVTQYEMHAVEDLGLLKFDFLGLKNLTIIEHALNEIKEHYGLVLDLDSLPPNDPETFEIFKKAETTGVFQLESQGMKRYLKEIKPTSIEDIIAMVALFRPGPIELIPEYIARKHGRKPIEYLHPKLEPILRNTYGIPVYQEQILQIARDLAAYTLGEADVLRKAIGKKIKELMHSERAKFINRSTANGISQYVAEQIFNFIEPFAGYSFNRSHAACYALIAYQTAYLKAHYPLEFMASLMNAEAGDVERIAVLIQEARDMSIKVLPPDINQSGEDFTVIPEQRQIRFGLLAVKNVGENIVAAIVKERKARGRFTGVIDFAERIQCKDLNKKSLESLAKAGAFHGLADRNTVLVNADRLLEINRELSKTKSNGQGGLFDAMPISSSVKLAFAEPASKQEKLMWEKELLGLYISSHPMEDYKDKFKNSLEIKAVTAEMNGQYVKVAGVLNTIQKIITKSGQPMLFCGLEDLSGKIETLVFPSTLQKFPTCFQENNIVVTKGRVTDRDGVVKLICEEIRQIV